MSKLPTVTIKYHLRDYRNTIIGMYLCVYIICILIFISDSLRGRNLNAVRIGSFNGLEIVSAITIFIVGLNSFKENFKFFMVNGISRKTQLVSTAVSLGILSALFAFIDTINSILFRLLINLHPLFLQMYAPRYGIETFKNNLLNFNITPQMLAENFLWLIFLYFFISMIGLSITTLYYRMNRSTKIAVSIAVPLIFFNGIPAIDEFFFQGVIHAFLVRFAKAAWGFTAGYNPYIAMVSMFLFAAIFGAVTYLLARRAAVRK